MLTIRQPGAAGVEESENWKREKEKILAQRDQDLEQAKAQHQEEVAALLKEHAEKLQNSRRHVSEEVSQLQRQLEEANERLATLGSLVGN